ncbi:MAG: ATP-binding cassette domain-containing protein, partial [Myxococcales bacterium]|nr:ATP-binding cassette domain-containing protein [Myxococcales bacterium]
MSLELRGVRKAFGPVVAVDRIDLVLEPGTFVGLIGHNGAGKSTTLKMITGMLRPTEGEIRIGGIDVFADPLEARKRFGAVPENPALYEYMTAREF